MTNSIFKEIQAIVVSHILQKYGNNISYSNNIYSALKILLKGTFEKYDFQSSSSSIKDEHFQDSLAKVNEKESRRKSAGVFYTDNDVTDFMVLNSFNQYLDPTNVSVYSSSYIKKYINGLNYEIKRKILQLKVFDPTCGAGAFLVSALAQKLELLKSEMYNDVSLEELVGTIHGNDIESTSTDITKLRLFFLIVDSFEENINIESIAEKISNCFYNVDAINYKGGVFKKYDIIVGNPPYIEYGKYEGIIVNDYGNVYADVMKNVATMLNNNGVLAFVVPLSYISTARMRSIREFINSYTGKQLLLNFADRPDCLFTGVHQKLTIVFAQKTKEISGVYSSQYYHWYKTEREKLFDNLTLEKFEMHDDKYWPKLGNPIALSIYNKMLAYNGIDFFSLNKSRTQSSLYVNMRACFWMKVFSKEMKSNSYKEYKIDSTKIPFVFCLLNSSLFFLIWTIISDGWHITNKELSFVKIPTRITKQKKWLTLLEQLENKLENTKEYVGTKQVDYEYKHKLCKDIIDEIDNELKSIYKLSETELKYIKGFNEKYRISDGA